MPRLVVPGYPHHVTQRGARRMQTFFSPDDYQYYLDLVSHYKALVGVSIWAYCLMPNHVHFVAVPAEEDSLARLFRRVHREYTRAINFRHKWRGHLWQERFNSFVMDEEYLLATVRYVELNPVKAKLCESPESWSWSSAEVHLQGVDDAVVEVAPMLQRITNWREYLSMSPFEGEYEAIRRFSSSGRPAGDGRFIEQLEALTGRRLGKGKQGPKARV